jgi:hypothetical protein
MESKISCVLRHNLLESIRGMEANLSRVFIQVPGGTEGQLHTSATSFPKKVPTVSFGWV